MDAEYANYYTREVMLILIREFQSPDEEMKKIVLKVCKNIGLITVLCSVIVLYVHFSIDSLWILNFMFDHKNHAFVLTMLQYMP